jgi:hypothetical protein
LFARPFNEQRLEFSGEPVRVVDGIPVIGFGRAPFSVSAAGVLAYWPYAVGTPSVLRWFDRNGRASAAVDTPAQYIGFAISPDGRQLALSRTGKVHRINIKPTILEKDIEETVGIGQRSAIPQISVGVLEVQAFSDVPSEAASRSRCANHPQIVRLATVTRRGRRELARPAAGVSGENLEMHEATGARIRQRGITDQWLSTGAKISTIPRV